MKTRGAWPRGYTKNRSHGRPSHLPSHPSPSPRSRVRPGLRSPHQAIRGPIAVFAAPSELKHCRFGLSISRKVGNAVRRNRLRRQLREAFRQLQHDFPGAYDLVVTGAPMSRRRWKNIAGGWPTQSLDCTRLGNAASRPKINDAMDLDPTRLALPRHARPAARRPVPIHPDVQPIRHRRHHQIRPLARERESGKAHLPMPPVGREGV